MKSWGLFVITAATILFTGIVLFRSSWSHRHATRTAGPTLRTAARESLSPTIALRHAQNQPRHWRDCLMAR